MSTIPAGFDETFPSGATGSAAGFVPPEPYALTTGSGDGLDWLTQNLGHETGGPNTPIVTHQWGEPTAQRDQRIFHAIESGMASYAWGQIVTGPVDNTYAIVPVLTRVLRLGETNPTRVSVNYATHQHIVDLLGGACLTPFVADQMYAQAEMPLQAMPENGWVLDHTMAATSRMLEYSALNDARVSSSLVERKMLANESKLWIVTARFWNDPSKHFDPNNPLTWWAANYGWWSKNAPNGRLYQSTGLAHDFHHVDYSQCIQCMGQWVALKGKREGLAHVGRVLQDPVLCKLLSDEGPLPSWKHPAFPVDWNLIPPLPGQIHA